MLAGALIFVARFGSNVPSWDGWDMVPMLTGNQPVTPEWLWSQHNEHRVPLPRLALLAMLWAKVDFRIPMLVHVLALGALALAMIAVAQHLRGGSSITDVFFPLLLLNVGQAPNLLWAWQAQFFSSTLLAGAVLLAIALIGTRLRLPTAALLVGLSSLLLPLCGANGVALVPALALWLVGSAVWVGRNGEPGAKRRAATIAALAAAALALTGLYFVGYERVPYHPTSPGLAATLRTAVQFFTIGFGPGARTGWPASGLLALGLLLASVVVLIRLWRQHSEDRPRALGMLAFLGALASLALGLGLGRDGFETRYVTLAIPAWCCVYLAFSLDGRRSSAAFRAMLLGIMVVLLWPNTRFGLAYGADLRSHLGAFERDLVAGVPANGLIERYGAYLHPHPDVPSDYLPMLRRAEVGPYRFLEDAPPMRELRVPLRPSELHQVRWADGVARATGTAPYVVFTLPQPVAIRGIRLRYSHHNDQGTLPYVSVYWKRAGQDEFTSEQFWKYSPTGDRANWERGTWTRRAAAETVVGLWVTDTITAIRIHPDLKPGVFRISELSVLVPAEP